MQLNSTYYSAVGSRDNWYLLARAIQFFTPGIPLVYYVGLLAGANDIDLVESTQNGRDLNRHKFDSVEEAAQEIERPVVRVRCALDCLCADSCIMATAVRRPRRCALPGRAEAGALQAQRRAGLGAEVYASVLAHFDRYCGRECRCCSRCAASATRTPRSTAPSSCSTPSTAPRRRCSWAMTRSRPTAPAPRRAGSPRLASQTTCRSEAARGAAPWLSLSAGRDEAQSHCTLTPMACKALWLVAQLNNAWRHNASEFPAVTRPGHGPRSKAQSHAYAFRGLARVLAGEELPDDCPEAEGDEDAQKFSFDSPAMSGNDVVDLMKSPNSRTAEDDETSLEARPLSVCLLAHGTRAYMPCVKGLRCPRCQYKSSPIHPTDPWYGRVIGLRQLRRFAANNDSYSLCNARHT